jgi:hypothetical protein
VETATTFLDMDIRIVVALIAALASLAVAVATFFSTRSNQRNIEQLKAQLAEQQAEKNARRDYEYEARKRLYHECGPLIFQLLEQAELVRNRIHNLARTAAGGNLNTEKTWLARDYYRCSTLHRFIAPLATMKLIQSRLTHVDLSVDTHLHRQYVIGKQVIASFGDDFDLAKLTTPRLVYDPHNADAHQLRHIQPDIYWQQGIPAGILDNAAESLIAKDADGGAHVMSFAEFETEYARADSTVRRAFDRISYLFDGFHPRTRPVLWRLILAQAALYRVLLKMPRDRMPEDGTSNEMVEQLRRLAAFSDGERTQLDWRQAGEEVEDAAVLVQPFEAVDAYVAQHLQRALGKIGRT